MTDRSFSVDVRPLFKSSQITCMQGLSVFLDDYTYMSSAAGDNDYADHANAKHVLARLVGDEQPRMPRGGPFWLNEELNIFKQWIAGGFKP